MLTKISLSDQIKRILRGQKQLSLCLPRVFISFQIKQVDTHNDAGVQRCPCEGRLALVFDLKLEQLNLADPLTITKVSKNANQIVSLAFSCWQIDFLYKRPSHFVFLQKFK